MEELLQGISQLIQYIEQNGENLDQESQQQLAAFLQDVMTFVESYQAPQEPSVPTETPIPPSAELLWILAGGQQNAFISFLGTYPDQALNALARNPAQLESVVERLETTMPQGRHEVRDGVEQAPIGSSNIWGFKYNPKSGRLLVRFQSGSVYGYNGVPPTVFRIFQEGAIPAKTNGQNAHGRWWQGKIPSLGAAFYELIRNGGYEYQRLS